MPKVRANLVVGSNGMSRKAGSSQGLSSPADRVRFHQLRRDSDVILVGGSTYRNEPYSNCPLPLYISTRGKTSSNKQVSLFNLSPTELIMKAKIDGFESILIEGGVNFLRELIRDSLIDELYLTRTDALGDSDNFDENELRSNYKIINESTNGRDCFEVWGKINPEQ